MDISIISLLRRRGKRGVFNPLSNRPIGFFVPKYVTRRIIMRLNLFSAVMLMTCMQVFADGNAQKLQISVRQAPLSKVLDKIEQQTGYSFWIQTDLLKQSKRVTLDLKGRSLEEALSLLFKDMGLSYSFIDKTIVVVKASERSPAQGLAMPPAAVAGPGNGTGQEDLLLRQLPLQYQVLSKKLVRGTVVDEAGLPLPGVNILVKGTSQGASTDSKGAFEIAMPAATGTLIFSFIGYTTQEVSVGNKEVLEIRLQPNLKTLDEVVVIGYGTSKRGDLTGAVSTVKADVFDEARQSSFINSIQGRVAGLQITSGSGEPGSGSKILIRGANSLYGDSRPLFVIDGVPVNESEAPVANSRFGANASRDPLSSINPADIVSIEVLKDASSTAIYGSRGANGVILVTTRQGKAGEAVVTYDGRVSVSHTARRLTMLNGEDWIDYRKDWALLPDRSNLVYGYFSDWLFFKNPSETEPSLKEPRDVYALPHYDWQREMYRDAAFGSAHNLSVSGGAQATKFFASVGYNREQGLFINNNYSRFNTRLRVDHHKNRLSLSLGLNGTFSRFNGAVQSGDGYANVGVTQAAVVSRPLVFSNPLAESTQGGWKMPTDNLKYVDRGIESPNLSANMVLNFKLLEGLYIGNTASGTLVTSKVNEFYSKNTPWGFYLGGRGAINNTSWFGWVNYSTLSYEKAFENQSRISALGVFEVSGSRYENSYLIKSSFADETTGIYDISKGVILQAAESSAGITHRLSYLTRFNYDYKNKYLVTGSLRADGSDRFGADNRFGIFPSAALAWKVTEEDFLKENSLVNDLKIRLSYGATGNSNIPEFRYMARMSNQYYDDQLGLAPSSLPNPSLKWETTTQYNAGFDLQLLGNRLALTFDLYSKQTSDMLYNAIVPAQSGFKTQWQNLGKISNKGAELALNTRNMERGKFSWSSSLTFTANRNKVLVIGDGLSEVSIGAGAYTTSYIKQNVVGRIMVGQPIGVMYGYDLAGIYQMDDFAGWKDASGILPDNDPGIAWQNRNWVIKDGVTDASSLGRIRPGTFKFRNADGSADNRITESDKVILGNSQPKFFGGLGNNFTYGPLEASVFLSFSVGNKVFNSTRFELEGAYPGEYFNITRDFWENRWTLENPTNTYPAYSDANYYNSLAALPNSYYVEDASYLRLQTISLGYRLPAGLLNRLGLKTGKLYYSGNNLYTLTGYSGFTPEVDSGNALLSGFDTIGYPRASSHSVGVTLTF
ncbi:TonB-dependent receptor [Ravibacter arvi]